MLHVCHITEKNWKHWVNWLCSFPCLTCSIWCLIAVKLSKSDFLVGNYHVIFFRLFVIFLIFSIFFKAIFLCVCSLCLTYSHILLLLFSQNMCFFLKENENIEKTRAFLLLPFLSLMALKIRTRLSTGAFEWRWGACGKDLPGSWQDAPLWGAQVRREESCSSWLLSVGCIAFWIGLEVWK